MRKYLKQFLMDKRVVDLFRPLWWLILNGPILTFRPSKSGKAYKNWDEKNHGSPLRGLQLNKQTKYKIFLKTTQYFHRLCHEIWESWHR